MSGTGADLGFWCSSAAAVWFGWRVFRTDSMVRASLSLLIAFSSIGAIAVLLLAEYLGIALVFMAALEMAVMALFMVAFMMNPAGLNPMSMVHERRAAIAAGSAGAAGLIVVALAGRFPERPFRDAASGLDALGAELLGGSMLVFESAGVALLAAMIGGVILSSHRGRYGDSDAGSHPPPLDPDAAPEHPDGGSGGAA